MPATKGKGRNILLENVLLFSFWIAFFSLAGSLCLHGQTYETTGASINWEDPAAWSCSGGPCGNNPFPGRDLQNDDVFIRHNINYYSNNPITIRNNSSIDISQGARLNLASNLNISNGGVLAVNGGSIRIGPGIMNNDGLASFSDAFVQKDGNYINNGSTTLANACIEILDGNFNNNGSL